MAIKNYNDDADRTRILSRLKEKQDVNTKNIIGLQVDSVVDKVVKKSIETLKAKGEI